MQSNRKTQLCEEIGKLSVQLGIGELYFLMIFFFHFLTYVSMGKSLWNLGVWAIEYILGVLK